jgi:hypothetical protein
VPIAEEDINKTASEFARELTSSEQEKTLIEFVEDLIAIGTVGSGSELVDLVCPFQEGLDFLFAAINPSANSLN